MPLSGIGALVKSESSQVGFTDEATTTSDDTIYQITDSAKRIWGFNSTIVVEDAAVPTVEPYTVNRLNGTITFESSDGGRVITVTGDYVLLTTVAEAKEWSADISRDMLDNTVFQDQDRSFQPGLIGGTATIGKFYDTSTYFIDMLLDGTTKVIELYADSTDTPIIMYANVSAESITSAVEALTMESISLQITNKMIMEV